MLIGSVGYGLAAAAFGALALLMLTSWRGRLQGGLLVTAAGMTALWAGAIAFAPETRAHWQLVGLLEISSNTAWLVFLARLSPAGQGLDGTRRQLFAHAPAAIVFLYGTVSVAAARGPDTIPILVQSLVLTGLATSIGGLVLLEQAFRAMRAAARAQILPLVIGLGGILAYDLFLYSHGLLFLGLHEDLWAARGFAILMAAPFLLLAARRNPDWSVDVFVSRQVAFYTTSLVGVGVYLLVMAVAGYGLRIAGGEWGFTVQVMFFFGSLVVLAWVLFSPSARAAVRVFLAKHFYSNKYDYRQEWLKLTQRLAEDRSGEQLPVRGLDAMVSLAGASGGVLWAIDSARDRHSYCRIAVVGAMAAADGSATPDSLPADDPLVAFLAERRWTVNVAEALQYPQSHPGLRLPGWLQGIHDAAFVVPLLNQGRLWGLIVLIVTRRVDHLSYEDIDLFRVAGMQIAAVLAQAEADRLLSESRQFEAYSRFAAFIMHDLKNVIAQQSLVVRNAAKYRDDPEFIDDVLDTVANSVERMQRLLEQLKQGGDADQVERVDIGRLVSEIVRQHTDREPCPTAELTDSPLRLRINRARLAAVLGHVISNAQDATPPNGYVRVEACLDDDWLVLAVEDNGAGMEESFIRERLFRPFDSTKGSKGMGIGAYQAKQFIESLGGEIKVRSAPAGGTRVELRFPPALIDRTEGIGSPLPDAREGLARG